VLAAYEASLDGFSVAVNGVPKGVLPGGVVLEPGIHEVSLRGPDAEEISLRVQAAEDEIIDLAELVRREPPDQLELQVGGGFLPGSELGAERVWTGGLRALYRHQGWPVRVLDLSLALGLAGGEDRIRVNQEEIPLDLLAFDVRLGLGAHLSAGRFQLHLDAWGGAESVLRWFRSAYYRSPRTSWSGLVGLSTAARLRLSRHWSWGLGLEVRYLLGELQGLGLDIYSSVAWSF
jgi:hypothetical protein